MLLGVAVRLQGYAQYEVIVWLVNLIDDIEVEGLDAGDALVELALLDQCICDASEEDTEDVADTEVYPARGFLRILCKCSDIIGWQCHTSLLPCSFIL